jgi:hypothetical protein
VVQRLNKWTSISNEDTIEWLLEKDNPSIQYYTLTDLLDYPLDHPDVVEANKTINIDSRVERILSKQDPKGHWESVDEPYRPKYKSSFWQVMILSLLGLDKTNPRVRKSVEYVCQFQHEEGGFTTSGNVKAKKKYLHLKEKSKKKRRKVPSESEWIQEYIHDSQLTCLTGNVCLALIRMGYASDERVKNGLNWLVRVQNEDGGWLCPYWKAHAKDKHGCFMGTITPLDAISELPLNQRTPEMERSLEAGIEFLLMHHLFRADHHDFKVIKESWLTFGFPQFFYDILRGLSVVCKSEHADDKRIDEALSILLEKQQDDGSWILESSPIGRMQTNLEQKGKPSKWITFKALKVIKTVNETRGSLPTVQKTSSVFPRIR